MRNKKRRLAMLQQRQAEFEEHQSAIKAIADQEAKIRAEAVAKAEADAAVIAKAKPAAKVKRKPEVVHSADLASPINTINKPTTKKSKRSNKK
jgi:hypothetical protein